MAAPLNPNQLKMFMRPGEVVDAVDRSIDYGRKDVMNAQLRTDVLDRASRRGSADWGTGTDESLRESVAEVGVQRPIILQHVPVDKSVEGQSVGARTVMGNGHHRLASAMDAEKTTGRHSYIPVLYDDDFMGKGLGDAFPGMPRD